MKRALYKPLGFFFLALAIAGVMLPVLPGTPFAILAAWFFARSSEKWHQRLLSSKLFGPMIHNWEDNRCLSCQTKLVALVSMICAGGASLVFAVEDPLIRIVGTTVLTTGVITVLCIKTCTRTDTPT